MELLKQGQYVPMPVEKQVCLLFSATHGFLDYIPLTDIPDFEEKFLDYLETSHLKVLKTIKKEKKLSDELIKSLKKIIEEFKRSLNYGKYKDNQKKN